MADPDTDYNAVILRDTPEHTSRVASRRGFVYAAFVIEVFARRIIGWR